MSDSKPTTRKTKARGKTRKPRVSIPKSVGSTWKEKAHPFLIRAAKHRKVVHRLMESPSPEDQEKAQNLIRHPPEELVKEARAIYAERKKTGKPLKYQTATLLFSMEHIPEGVPVKRSRMTLSWFCLFKFGKPLRQLLREYEARNWKAMKQMNRLAMMYDAWRVGRLDVTKAKHKIDEPHFGLMMLGLNFGLDSMTAEEMADCYDALCVCGKAHSAENLGKLRWRMIRMLEKIEQGADV